MRKSHEDTQRDVMCAEQKTMLRQQVGAGRSAGGRDERREKSEEIEAAEEDEAKRIKRRKRRK